MEKRKVASMGEMVEAITKQYGITKAQYEVCLKEIISHLPNPKYSGHRRSITNAIFKNKRILDITVNKSVNNTQLVENVETISDTSSSNDNTQLVETISDTSSSNDNTQLVESISDTSSSNDNTIWEFSFRVSSLVCGQFQGTMKEFAEREIHKEGSSCGVKAFKIAHNLVKVAATRIFSDPSQCILEILTNSIDSYRRLNAKKNGTIPPLSIGKFGMGFMSVFWWILNKDPNHHFDLSNKKVRPHLVVISYTENDPPYLAVIYENTKNELTCDFYDQFNNSILEEYNIVPHLPRKHGTHIQLVVPAYENWQTTPRQLFFHQINKLRYVKDILLISRPSEKEIENLSTTTLNQNVIIYSDYLQEDNLFALSIDDFAEGIPKNIFFGPLLSPTLSTKTLTVKYNEVNDISILPSRIENVQSRDRNGNGGIVITVGDIVLVDPSMIGNPDNKYRLGRVCYILSLPLSTTLPVSRDDIIVTYGSPNYANVFRCLREIIDLLISERNPIYNLDFLIKSLNVYAIYSNQSVVYTLIKEVLDYIKSLSHMVSFVPNIELFQIIKENFPNERVCLYEGCSIDHATQYVNKLFDNLYGDYGINVIKGMRIVPAIGIHEPKNVGIPSVLFFPFEWKDYAKEELVSNITSRISRLILEEKYESKGYVTEAWNTFWETTSLRSIKEALFGHSTQNIVKLQKTLDDVVVPKKTHKYTDLDSFADEINTLLDDVFITMETFSGKSHRELKRTLDSKINEILYLIKNNYSIFRIFLDAAEINKDMIATIQVLSGVHLIDIYDNTPITWLSDIQQYEVYEDSIPKDRYYDVIDTLEWFEDVLENTHGYKKFSSNLKTILGDGDLRSLFMLREYLQSYSHLYKKYRNNIGTSLVIDIDRVKEICDIYDIDKRYIFIDDVLLSKKQSKSVISNTDNVYTPYVETLFSATLSFASSINSKYVKIFSSGKNYASLEEINAITFESAIFAIYFLINYLESISNTTLSFSSKEENNNVYEYINRVISYFTTTNFDIAYASKFTITFIPKIFLDPLLSSIGYPQDTYDTPNLDMRKDLIVEGMFSSLRAIEYRGRESEKTISFLNAFHLYNIAMGHLANALSSHKEQFIELCNQIVRQCHYGFEASVVSLVFFYFIEEEKMEDVDTLSRWVEMIFSEVRIKYSVEFMREWMNYNHNQDNSQEYVTKYKDRFFTPLVRTLRLCVSYTPYNIQQISLYNVTSYHEHTFTANQLIDYIFSEKDDRSISTKEDLHQFLCKVETSEYSTQQFQMVQIAANEGTSKPFVDSVFTELVQNAVDAIREKHQHNLDYSDYVSVTIDENILGVGDPVGIPISAYLSLWIPFLSSKSESVISTGEMGTGLFNIYRQPWCDHVEIISNGIRVIATPILDPNFEYTIDSKTHARVIDIKYHISIPQHDEILNGTLIKVFLSKERLSVEENISLVMEGAIYVQTQLAFTPFRIELNGRTVSSDMINIYEGSVGKCFYTGYGVQYPSLLLTNGIPIGLLKPYLEEIFGNIDNPDIENGIVVDLNKGYYKPTQSRNRLVSIGNVDKDLYNMLEYCIMKALVCKIHYKVFQENRKDILEAYFPDATSRAPLSGYRKDILNSKKTVLSGECFADFDLPKENNEPGWDVKSTWNAVKTIINDFHWGNTTGPFAEEWKSISPKNEFSEVIVSEKHIDLLKRYMETLEGMHRKFPEIIDLVFLWFRGKNLGIRYRQSTFEVSTSPYIPEHPNKTIITQDVSNQINELNEIINLIIGTYYETGGKINNVDGLSFNKGPPLFEILPEEGGFIAYYSKKEHKIVYSYSKIQKDVMKYIASWHEFISKVKNSSVSIAISYFRTKCMIWDIIGKKLPAANIIHEIQHALFSEGHNEDSHGMHTFILEGKRYNIPFEESCALVYENIMNKGFLLRLCERVK